MRMGIKIFDRKTLHVMEHIISQILQCSLCHIYHDPVIGKGSQNTDQIEYRNLQDRSKQRTEIRTALPDQWHDIQIDQIFHKHGSLDIGNDTDENTHCHNYQMNSVIFSDIF